MWNPDQYLKFGAEREQPAMDLIASVPLEAPKRIYDLGCGAGNVTMRLKERWPEAKIDAWDISAEMLEKARKLSDDIALRQRDLTDFDAMEKADMIYCNAVLHFVENHEAVFPALLEKLNPGGALAVHIPNNFEQPSHTSISETVLNGPWRDRLMELMKKREKPILSPEGYYDLLQPRTQALRLWETTYYQFLDGENPVREWFKGSALLPFFEALDTEEERDAFLQDYGARVKAAYKKTADGKTSFPFHRLFMLAMV